MNAKQQEIANVVTRCQLACGAESQALGFPEQAGYDVFAAAIAADCHDTDEMLALEAFLDRYQLFGDKATMLALYKRCCEIMGEYAPLLKSVAGEPGEL